MFINFTKQMILFDELVKQNKFGSVLRRVSCVEHEKDTVLFSLSFILLQEMDILRKNKGCRDFLDSLSEHF
ncbi:hypothetical protein FPV32_19705 [Bacillus tequilensis]|nr:hypothetical protein [Bacillus tequilensis]